MIVLVLVVAVSIAVGLVVGGKLANLARVQLRASGAIVALFLVQALLRQVGPRFGIPRPSLIVWLWCGVSLLLTIVAIVNWRVKGMSLIAAGIALNLVVVALNVGMPVGGGLARWAGLSPGEGSIAARGGFYVEVDSQTTLPELGDVVPLPGPASMRVLVSAGDLIMFLGVFVLVVAGMRSPESEDRVPE